MVSRIPTRDLAFKFRVVNVGAVNNYLHYYFFGGVPYYNIMTIVLYTPQPVF